MKIKRLLLSILCIVKNTSSFSLSRTNFIRNTASMVSVGSILNPKNDQENTPESQEQQTPSHITDNSYPLMVRFYSPVTIESCVALTSYLKSLDMRSKQLELQYGIVFPIKLHIQSSGGMLMPTFYVCDVIKTLDTPVYIYIDGYVASAASLISICGSKRYMTKHSFMLIHQLQSQSSGRLNEMKDEISNLDFFNNNAKDIYYENSNISEPILEKLLSDELWIDAYQCLQLGLIDEII